MSKWFEVEVTKTIVYAVEVKDSEGEEEAQMYALDECSLLGNSEVKSREVQGLEVDSIKRHCDYVMIDPDD